MNRSRVFHTSMAAYGVVVGADTLLSVLDAGVTAGVSLGQGATLAASALVVGYGVYGLRHPEATSDVSDSRLAYLVAAAAVLVFLSVLATRL